MRDKMGETLKKKPSSYLFSPVALILALLVCFMPLSCDGDNGPKVGIVYDLTGKNDRSFNESAYEGIKRAEAELGASVSEETTDGSESNREELIRSLAENNDLVIAVGFSFENSIKKIAAEYPDTDFVGVDIRQGENPPANFASLLFDETQGSFLVGAAAALTTKTNKVGFIGGVCSTSDKIIERFEAGFVDGVRITKLGTTVKTEYLSHGEDLSGFSDTEKAKKVAERMFEDGADVIFHAAGASGAGLFEAAAEGSKKTGHLWAIGVDSDQYRSADESVRGHILTSMLKRVDVAIYNIIKTQRDGEFRGGEVRNDLENGGVDYSTSGGFVDGIKDRLELTKDWIVKGHLKISTDTPKSCEQQTYP